MVGIVKIFLQYAKDLKCKKLVWLPSHVVEKLQSEARAMRRHQFVRYKTGCITCGKKSGVSPFIKTKGQLICRVCYYSSKRTADELNDRPAPG